MKFLLPASLVVAVIGLSLFTFVGTPKNTQQAQLYGSIQQITLPFCMLHIGPNGTVVAPTPQFRVDAPNGGEVYQPGQQITAKWSKCGILATANVELDLTYQVPNGPSGSVVLLASTPNDGVQVLNLPTPGVGLLAGVPAGTYYKLKVSTPVNNVLVQDSSDGFFTITPFCNAANIICLIGGNNDSGFEKDAWVFNTAQSSWSQLTSNASFGGRYAFPLLSYAGKNWVLGGWSRITNAVANDVWSSPDGVNWTQIVANAPWASRWYSAGVVFNNKMWVLGGGDPNGSLYNDVWSSTNGSTWTQSANAAWSARAALKALVFNNKIWVIGGIDNAYPQNDVWSSPDGTTWTPATSSAPWGRREYFGATVFQNKLWVIGGTDQLGTALNDVWSSPDGVNWTQVIASAPWSPRTNLSLVVSGNKLWIMGGRDNTGVYLNDVWSSTNGSAWTHVDNNSTTAGIQDAPWTGRWNASAIAQ